MPANNSWPASVKLTVDEEKEAQVSVPGRVTAIPSVAINGFEDPLLVQYADKDDGHITEGCNFLLSLCDSLARRVVD